MKRYHVYMLSNQSRTLYVGVTSDLERRIWQHKTKAYPGFTARYNVSRLVYFEEFSNVNEAIECEKRIKSWSRAKKIALIERENPKWEDLANNWFTSAQLR